MDNQITPVAGVKDLLNSEAVQKALATRLGSMTQASNFVTTVLEVVRNSDLLQKADPKSILNASMTAVSLNLPINSNLGFAYIVPYNQKQKDGSIKTVAQFQMGYKGFVQLAQRSGQFKTISATPIYDGQIVEANPLTGYVFDFTKRTSDTIVGFAGYFKLLNGFEKILYMTVSELQKHGRKYSKSYQKDYGLWEDNFEAMAIKTVLKLLLSKFAPLSSEMQKAIVTDQAVVADDGSVSEYVDNHEPPLELGAVNGVKQSERVLEFINKAETLTELQQYEKMLTTQELKDAYTVMLTKLSPKKVK